MKKGGVKPPFLDYVNPMTSWEIYSGKPISHNAHLDNREEQILSLDHAHQDHNLGLLGIPKIYVTLYLPPVTIIYNCTVFLLQRR